MARFLFGFVTGLCSGLYCAQNYDTPDVRTLISTLMKKVQDLEKENRKHDDDGRGGPK